VIEPAAVRKRFADVVPLFIDGKKILPAEGKTLDVVNPADGSLLAKVGAAGPADIDVAVKAARRAFRDPSWAKMAASARCQDFVADRRSARENAEELCHHRVIEQRQDAARGAPGRPSAVDRHFPLLRGLRDENSWRDHPGGRRVPLLPCGNRSVLRADRPLELSAPHGVLEKVALARVETPSS
jgi:hypothetical protein